jgi:transposase
VAVEAGENPDAVAARFMVGRATVYRWMTAARDEGRRAPRPARGGSEPVIRDSVEATLVHMVKESNHLTLSECRDRLAAETGVRVHPCTVSRALRRLPWT